jgi:hypothetical protein
MKIDFSKYNKEELEFLYVNLYITFFQIKFIPIPQTFPLNPMIEVGANFVHYLRNGLLQNGFTDLELQTIELELNSILTNTPSDVLEQRVNELSKEHIGNIKRDTKPDTIN